jgi:hypothetical protein
MRMQRRGRPPVRRRMPRYPVRRGFSVFFGRVLHGRRLYPQAAGWRPMRVQLRLLGCLLLHPAGGHQLQPPRGLRLQRRHMRMQRRGRPAVRRHMPRSPVRSGQSVFLGRVLHRGRLYPQATRWRSMLFQLRLLGWMLLRRDMHARGLLHRHMPPMTPPASCRTRAAAVCDAAAHSLARSSPHAPRTRGEKRGEIRSYAGTRD